MFANEGELLLYGWVPKAGVMRTYELSSNQMNAED